MKGIDLEQARSAIMNAFTFGFLKYRSGMLCRPDVCVALEYLVWLKLNRPTLLAFSDDKNERFELIREWLRQARLRETFLYYPCPRCRSQQHPCKHDR